MLPLLVVVNRGVLPPEKQPIRTTFFDYNYESAGYGHILYISSNIKALSVKVLDPIQITQIDPTSYTRSRLLTHPMGKDTKQPRIRDSLSRIRDRLPRIRDQDY